MTKTVSPRIEHGIARDLVTEIFGHPFHITDNDRPVGIPVAGILQRSVFDIRIEHFFERIRKVPLPVETVAEALVENGASDLALRYIEKGSSGEAKVNALEKFGFYMEAARVAREQLKNNALAQELEAKANCA
jgi:hypothetical protein